MLHFPGDQGISLNPSFHEGEKKNVKYPILLVQGRFERRSLCCDGR